MSTFGYLIRLWRHSLLLYIAGSLVSIVQWGFGILVLGMIVRAIFDAITLGASAAADVYTLCAVFMAFNVVGNMLVTPMETISRDVLEGFLQSRLQRNLFKTMLERRPVRDGPSSGETLNRYRDDVEAAVNPLILVAEMTGMVVALGAAVYVMASIDPLITVAAFLPAIIILTGTRLLGNRIETLRRVSREAASRVSGSLGELLNSVQALQVAGAEERAATHFEALGERRRKADMKEGLLDGLREGLNGSVVTLSTGVILLAAAHLMRAGSFTVGDFALFVWVAGGTNAGYAVRWIADFLASLRRARVSFARLAELVPEAPPQSLVQGGSLHLWGAIPEEPYPAKTSEDTLTTLEIRGLTHLRGEAGRGVHDVSLELPRGSFTVVTGRIGSGKTTLLEVLLGLLPCGPGRGALERTQGRGPAHLPRAPKVRLHPPGPLALQRHGAQQHPDGPRRRRAASWTPPCALESWSPTWPSWSAAWTRWWGHAACGSQAGRCSVPRRPACSCANRSSSSSTTCPAPSTSIPRRRSGSASSSWRARPASSCRTAERPWPAPTT